MVLISSAVRIRTCLPSACACPEEEAGQIAPPRRAFSRIYLHLRRARFFGWGTCASKRRTKKISNRCDARSWIRITPLRRCRQICQAILCMNRALRLWLANVDVTNCASMSRSLIRTLGPRTAKHPSMLQIDATKRMRANSDRCNGFESKTNMTCVLIYICECNVSSTHAFWQTNHEPPDSVMHWCCKRKLKIQSWKNLSMQHRDKSTASFFKDDICHPSWNVKILLLCIFCIFLL
jgi:hypothetical protein